MKSCKRGMALHRTSSLCHRKSGGFSQGPRAGTRSAGRSGLALPRRPAARSLAGGHGAATGGLRLRGGSPHAGGLLSASPASSEPLTAYADDADADPADTAAAAAATKTAAPTLPTFIHPYIHLSVRPSVRSPVTYMPTHQPTSQSINHPLTVRNKTVRMFCIASYSIPQMICSVTSESAKCAPSAGSMESAPLSDT